ncbi:arginyltransferase [Simiduia aestuariiviva]|uniref:Aspartate/glutamate leucyltransferase n=1 Tax=Simiduia aestuariiviva TaxID=1510459 RepID=A0A839UNI9_9GAMM|nr:arginyltransferase [Simiduia aestuariiviva]MBB3168311.1 arginine-tRNA-protein transferase [Simiduia aestuariiviva]
MSSSINLKLFSTHPHPCSYLEDQEATTVFVDPEAEMDANLYSRLSDLGFRRSGQHVYRPQCASCNACLPVRVRLAGFKPNRTQRRTLKRNADLTLSLVENIDTDECYHLYVRYISERHRDGDMYPPSRAQYRGFLTNEWGVTRFLEARLDGHLVGIAVCDELEHGLSAVYTYFDPDLTNRSLGSWFILQQILWTYRLNLPYLYLGYWIRECQKMNYKTQYQPLECLRAGFWATLLAN